MTRWRECFANQLLAAVPPTVRANLGIINGPALEAVACACYKHASGHE